MVLQLIIIIIIIIIITPLCLSVDGMLGSEAEFFVRRLGDFLAAKWERPLVW